MKEKNVKQSVVYLSDSETCSVSVLDHLTHKNKTNGTVSSLQIQHPI